MLDKKYNHQEVEKNKYEYWKSKNYFNADLTSSKEPFCIVIPPPNVTGKLHLGHAWDVTLQDLIIRYKRMQGYDCLWLPGMDHAGIATQSKVDKRLKEQGINLSCILPVRMALINCGLIDYAYPSILLLTFLVYIVSS